MERLRVAYIAAGAGGMYCGNCLHDNTLAKALLQAGHDLTLVPTYTPVKTDERNVSENRVFLGGLNVYLKQYSRWFQWTPRFLERWLDQPWLIRWATKFSISMRADELGALAVSVLQGEHGNQKKEIDELARFLAEELQPQAVHLSNVLLVGLVRPIRERLQTPIFCTLSGEDLFLQQLREPYTSKALALMRERAKEVTAFVAMNEFYKRRICELLLIEPERIVVVPHGLELAGHHRSPRVHGDVAEPPAKPEEWVLGYLGRISPEKGLVELAEAFVDLCKDTSLPPGRLRLAGYMGAAEKPYLAKIQAVVADAGFEDRLEYHGETSRDGKIAFMHGLDLFCMPSVFPESKGIPVMEALANGVPVAAPRHGAFVELIESTGGGELYPPGDRAAMAACLRGLLLDRGKARALGAAGFEAIHRDYPAERMAERTAAMYHKHLVPPPAETPDATPQSESPVAAS